MKMSRFDFEGRVCILFFSSPATRYMGLSSDLKLLKVIEVRLIQRCKDFSTSFDRESFLIPMYNSYTVYIIHVKVFSFFPLKQDNYI